MEMTQCLDDDLARMEDLSVDNIQKCLRSRYDRDLIYTNVSDILIAVNPCKPLPIYDSQTHGEYRPHQYDPNQRPHIFQVATAAYRRMWETDTDQVIIVSGESGAGKTESTKYMVKHMVHMCNKGQSDLHDKIVEINPLLEAFGNAKTTMNENSSRYAKYLELSFKENEELAGVVVRDYMLEKSRVVHQNDGEGVFHFFYALFAGCPRDTMNDLFLEKTASSYRILQSDEESLTLTSKYKRMYDESMSIMGKLEIDHEILHCIIAAVILIAEIDFYEDSQGSAQITEESIAPYKHAAMLLDLDEIEFGEALVASTKTIKGNKIATWKTVSQAKDGRDALAKMLYERMFGWLIRMINSDLHPNRQGTNILASIGILDIAGFEKLRTNSFEQLCINVVNEKLQNFMNDKIFKLEIDIYRQEGIQLDGIDFKNNDPLLEMFDKPKVGVWAILDENAKLAHGSDEGFVKQLRSEYGGGQFFTETRSNRPEFSILHFAANVLYDADGFVEKNRDRLNEELVAVMMKSTNDFISDLFTIKRGPTGTISMEKFDIRKSKRSKAGVPVMLEGKQKLKPTPKGAELAAQLGKSLNHKFHNVYKPSAKSFSPTSKQTLVSCFKASLGQLLEKLGDGNTFFVRCIKANISLSPNLFDDAVVTDQLTYNGLAEIAKIRKMGFDVRKNKNVFFSRYKFLFMDDRQSDDRQRIVKQTPSCFHQHFRCGKTKIFMTSDLHSWLERVLTVRRNAAAFKVAYVVRKVGNIKHQEKERIRLEELRLKREAEEADKLNKSFEGFETKPPYSNTVSRQSKNDSVSRGSPEPSTSTGDSTPYGSRAESERDIIQSDETVPHGDQMLRPPSPVIHIHDENKENEKKREKERKDGLEFWDVCQVIAREREIRDVDEDRGLQVVKVLTYFLIFCILFFCAVAQKISLVLLVKIPYNHTADREIDDRDEDALKAAARHVLITIAILIPYCLIFLTSVFKWMFGNFQMPNVSSFVWCVFTEILHSIGLSMLCFMVLPKMDMILGLFVINGVAIIPSVMLAVCASDVREKKNKQRNIKKQEKNAILAHKITVHVLNTIVLLLQFGYIPVVLLTDHFSEFSLVDENLRYIIFFVLSMVFISFSWWENFVDDRLCGKTSPKSCWKQAVLKLKFDLQESRPIMSTMTSLVKIGVTILMSFLTKAYLEVNIGEEEKFIENISMSDAFAKLNEMKLKENTSILVLTLCTFVGHYVGYTACKLKLQKFSFNIPLLLSTPVAVTILFFVCSDEQLLGVFTDEDRTCSVPSLSSTSEWIQYSYGILVWISLYWLCRHIFYPNIERLAKTERLFINPFYCGILFEQHLLMNRRRHTRKIYKETKENNILYRLSEYNSKITIEDNEDEDISTDGKSSEDVNDNDGRKTKFSEIPMIYACATMWHETKYEMIQLMKSIYRMDKDQWSRTTAEQVFEKEDKDFYDFEAHIFFDDAMVLNKEEEWVPNEFVLTLVRIMDEAASSVHGKVMTLSPPYKVPTPYGGQIIFTLPGGNLMFVHLKDKNKIRHRKRWSQVMYMYYLLGFRIVRISQELVKKALNEDKINALCKNWGGEDSGGRGFKSHIFRAFDDQIIQKASNTFLLALDGDVDFSPGAVRLLLDRMKKSEKVGAACGRIHPIGTGPVVWFQKFEYAIAHWLQKATEHVLGCVLCSPGCFSMFRGSALMDDNVMKKYTILPTEAAHHLMYDQGEDRWLCTLLLQQGYRVDYAAGSDAFTYAPEGFAEFFNQRRRWMPSTVFNIVDLLADYKNTVYVNTNISMLYILYQGALLLSTVVGPATVVMMIATANMVVFKVSIIWGYAIALAPAVFYFILCFYVKAKVQVQVAEVLTGLYAFVMMIVLVGTIVTAVKSSPFHPSVVFLAFLVIAFSFSAVLHPKEWSCIIFGALYFLLIPTGFLLLNIYSLCNLHNVSWGTREVPKKLTKKEEEEAKLLEDEKKRKKKEQGWFGKFFPQFPAKDFKDMFAKLIEAQGQNQTKTVDSNETSILRKEINELKELVQNKIVHPPPPEPRTDSSIERQDPSDISHPKDQTIKGILKRTSSEHKHVGIADKVKIIDEDRDEVIYDKVTKGRDDLINPAWAEVDELKKGKTLTLAEEEMTFWKGFLEKYLKPLEYSDEKKKNDAAALIDLRNNIALGMAMINMLWIAINFMFQFQSPTAISLPLTGDLNSENPDTLEENLDEDETETADNILKVDVLGLLFIFFYLAILLLQFFGMLVHRWGTLLHLVSVTKLKLKLKIPCRKKFQNEENEDFDQKELSYKDIKSISYIADEPEPDYSDSISDEEQTGLDVERQIKDLQSTGSRFQMQVSETNIGATSRTLNRTGVDKTMSTEIRQTITELKDKGGQLRDKKLRYNKYGDIPLPHINKRKGRMNFGPGRSELLSRLNENPSLAEKVNPSDSQRPRVQQTDREEEIYDRIGNGGTLSRQFGKNVKRIRRTMQSGNADRCS